MPNEWDVIREADEEKMALFREVVEIAANAIKERNVLISRIYDAADLTVYPDGTYVMPRMAVGRYAIVPIKDGE